MVAAGWVVEQVVDVARTHLCSLLMTVIEVHCNVSEPKGLEEVCKSAST